MSRIGKAPITVPSGVEVQIQGRQVAVKGPKGELDIEVPVDITVRQDGEEILVERSDDERRNRALHGLTRSLVNNMVLGVSEGFSKELQIVGVGYRAAAKGSNALELQLGFSHPVNVEAPAGITFDVPEPTRIIVSGIDKQVVGQVAADIRSYRKPEPYKVRACATSVSTWPARPERRRSEQLGPFQGASASSPSGPQVGSGFGVPSPSGRVPFGSPHLRPGHRRPVWSHDGRCIVCAGRRCRWGDRGGRGYRGRPCGC